MNYDKHLDFKQKWKIACDERHIKACECEYMMKMKENYI
jgi:hypothetical protein